MLINSQGKKQSSVTSGTSAKAISIVGHEAKLNSIIQEINANHYCEQHRVADYVRLDGSHERFTIIQISQWAELIVSDFSDIYV